MSQIELISSHNLYEVEEKTNIFMRREDIEVQKVSFSTAPFKDTNGTSYVIFSTCIEYKSVPK